jgi:hypothetical protein
MKRILQLTFLAGFAALIATAPASRTHDLAAMQAGGGEQDARTYRIILGMTDTRPTTWDGSLSVASGTLARLEPWRFDGKDRFEGTNAWKMETHLIRWWISGGTERTVVANGVVATLGGITRATEVVVETAQGKFSFRPDAISYGAAHKFLDGRVYVDRVPSSTVLGNSPKDQDYPAAVADREGGIWVAYLEFTGNPGFGGIRMAFRQPPARMADLAQPTAGDQILIARWHAGRWSDPIAVTEPGGDLYRPAIALDGKGRVWVFWSANEKGNFDLWARSVDRGRPGRPVRLTRDPGADIDPAAATDGTGAVWVAWQGFREGRGRILAARQNGDGFSTETTVAQSPGNEWNPAIAASARGEVAVAWDSYRNGNYDVFFRTADSRTDGGRFGPERLAAGSARYEAHPSLAYDGAGRLWIAWEESDEKWGKDFGAYESSGIGLYQGRWIGVQVWDRERPLRAPDLGRVLPGAPERALEASTRQGATPRPRQPDPQIAATRAPNGYPKPPALPLNSYPRVAADAGGRIWLAYRTPHPLRWSFIGYVWVENVVALAGTIWSAPTYVHHSDNLLDNRPALVSTRPDEIAIIRSADGRNHFEDSLRDLDPVAVINTGIEVPRDPYNNDIWLSRVALPASAAADLQPASLPAAAPAGAPQGADSRRVRDYRARIGGAEYRIVRGEFHRHTDVSMDADRDGSLLDAWRYALDAAAMDWVGCCDHDNGWGREYSWWITQKLTDVFTFAGGFQSLFSSERSVLYPEGHRNVVFAQRGVRTLPRLPKVDESSQTSAPDTRMLYEYVRHFNGIVASHTSGTRGGGTDWRDNDPGTETVVEIYQGDRQNYEMPGAPRANTAADSISGWNEKGFVSLALGRGYRLGFQSSSDHVSTHISYCNLWVREATREGILDAFRKRHVYGATDDIVADVRAPGDHMMGDEFETTELPSFTVKLAGTAPFAKVHVIKDSRYVYSIEPGTASVSFSWRDTSAEPGKTSYYYVRGDQRDGEIVWASPMWITYRGRNR